MAQLAPEGSDIRVHADWLLKGIILPIMTGHPEFQVKRADHDARPGLIDVQMINDLLDAELVIADLSLLNPNAFYEIGIRHVIEKPIIHMQLAIEGTPFDVAGYRLIKFARTQVADIEKAKDDLRNSINEVLAPGYRVENPVTKARGRLKLEQNATPETRVLMEEMDQLKSQVNDMNCILGVHSRLLLSAEEPLGTSAYATTLAGTYASAPALGISTGVESLPPMRNLEGNAVTGFRPRRGS